MKVQALLICLAGCAGAISTPGSAPGQCAPYAGDKSGYATTTEFDDNATGACGCSNPGGLLSSGAGSPNKIVLAAGSQNLFGPTTWCGAGCGKCFELENVGAVAADKMGDCGGAGQKITVMLTDVCATSNAEWCSQPVNQYGFDTHFDIGRSAGELGWSKSSF